MDGVKIRMMKYITGILISVLAVLYCTGLDGIKEKIKKPGLWIFTCCMPAVAILTAYFYEQPGNFLVFCVTLIFLGICVYIDIETGMIPNALVLFFLISGILTVPFNPSVSWKEAGIGFAATAAVFGAISFLSKGALGMGDVKLMSVLALVIGWKMFLTTLMIAIVASAVTGIFLLTARKKKRDARIPFSPFILIGAIICILL